MMIKYKLDRIRQKYNLQQKKEIKLKVKQKSENDIENMSESELQDRILKELSAMKTPQDIRLESISEESDSKEESQVQEEIIKEKEDSSRSD